VQPVNVGQRGAKVCLGCRCINWVGGGQQRCESGAGVCAMRPVGSQPHQLYTHTHTNTRQRTVDASWDGGPHKDEEEVEAAQREAGRLAGACEMEQEAKVGEQAGGKQLRRQALRVCVCRVGWSRQAVERDAGMRQGGPKHGARGR
jgi:hypothetical protein